MRCAVYARYSSDLQDLRSINDQLDMCRAHAQREGWRIVAEYSDAAISGASLHNRPGLQDLMRDAQARRFDTVLTESLDRLSRDLEDIAGLHKRLAFSGVSIITLADGLVGKLHVGLKGLVASIFLDDLRQKTRRGQIGRFKAGREPGGKLYGYDVGEDKGLRVINETEAAIVRRIFSDYIAGKSPQKIASELNREGVPGPRGGQWNSSTINGNPKRLNGILSSSTYAGTRVWGRQSFIKDPATGKRQARPNPPSEWLREDVPQLAIIDQATFDAAAQRRASMSQGPLVRTNRPKHLFSGLVACGCCGGLMTIRTKTRVGCSNRVNKGTCDNRQTIDLSEIEARVLSAIESHLLLPDVAAASIEAYRVERQRLTADRGRRMREASRDLAAVEGRIKRVLDAIENGDGDVRLLCERLRDLEREQDEIRCRVPEPIPDEALELHPNAAKVYRQKVARIREAMSRGDAAGHEAIRLVRELITRITVTPGAPGGPAAIDVSGNLALLLQLDAPTDQTVALVAGIGFEPMTFRL